jgi:predicted ATPase
MICPHCASQIPVGFQFCGSCGQRLDAVARHEDLIGYGNELLVPLIGRDAELRELMERWESARGGEPGIEICGQRGVGKTRLVKEAAKRIEGKRPLAVVARPGTRHRPFGMVRQLVHAVVCEVTGLALQLETREAFAGALGLLGNNLDSFVDVLWCVAAPNRLSTPSLGPQPQMLRWSLEPALEMLLMDLTEFAPDLTLFLDAYDMADEASRALFTSLNTRTRGWPLPVIVASREEGRISSSHWALIKLGPLADNAAAQLLDRLLRGARLPETLRQGVLARAAGIPLHIEELVRILMGEGVLTPTRDRSGWSFAERATAADLRTLNSQAVVRRLAQPERDLLGQCAIQGIEFDPQVTEAVRRLIDWHGPPVRVLLPKLGRQGLVRSVDADRRTLWFFSLRMLQEACYEMLSPPERRRLHAKTAEALCELAGGWDAVPPELLAYHYEHAEQWIPAAEANLQAGDRAAELFLNEKAVDLYHRAVTMLDLVEVPSEEKNRLAALAYASAARVFLRIGAYALAEEDVRQLQFIAVHSRDRAEADRLAALVCVQTGRTAEAERLLLEVAASDPDDVMDSIRARALCDLARLYRLKGRGTTALERLHECRAIAGSGKSLSLVRADVEEGDIAADEGRLADAVALYARAYHAVQSAGSLSELARASNGLGLAARHLGDHETAQRHIERALGIWKLTGEAYWVAGAYSNLGSLAMSQGDFGAAQEHYERALATFRVIGDVAGSAFAKANLAILAREEEDFPIAIAVAEASLAMLSESGNAALRAQVRVVLSEARLECGDAIGAQREFTSILQDYDEAQHPLAVAQAWRGLGRVALMMGAPDEALGRLDRAFAGFERLQRVQEAGRTALYRALALRQLGQTQRARSELERTREQFISIRMRANRDAEHAEQLLRELSAAPRSP